MPVFTGIIAGALVANGIAVTAAGLAWIQLGVSVGMSLISKALAGEQEKPKFSIRGQVQTGGEVPRSFGIGEYMTAGSLAWHSEWGKEGNTTNAYYTRVIALSDLPVSGLKKVFINGQEVTFRELQDGETEDEKGRVVNEYVDSNDVDLAWVKFYDGTQTQADSFLTGTVNNNGPRPYEGTRVGRGIAYAIVTYRLKRSIFKGFPKTKFILDGVPLYDVSKDSSQGGSGSHRWSNPSTWGGDGDKLPAVQAYNLSRGIHYNGEWFYGLQGLTSARVPSGHWVGQIEKCRAEVEGADGAEPTYRCSGEIEVNVDIASSFEAVLTSCAGRMSEVGGVFKIYVGAPDAPVASFTDKDIVSTEGQTFTPFNGLSNTINGVVGTYPSPEEGFVMRATPPLYNADYEAEDGNRRLMTKIAMTFVPYPVQAQRLLKGELDAARRARRHTLTLPAKFRRIEPGDTVLFNSERNGYGDKWFRVDGVDDLGNCDRIVDLTEVDPTDHGSFDIDTDYEEVVPSDMVPVRPTIQGVVGFDPDGAFIQDGEGTARRPAGLMQWATTIDDIDAIIFETRIKINGEALPDARSDNFDKGELLIEAGLVSLTEYESRAKYIPGTAREVSWTSWVTWETGDHRLAEVDFEVGSMGWSVLGQDVHDQIASAGDAGASAGAALADRILAEAAKDGSVAAQGITEIARDVTVAATVALIPSDVGAVPEAWTQNATSTGQSDPRPGLPASAVFDDDADFGNCAEIGPGNKALGHAKGVLFSPDRSFLVTYTYKASDDGSGTLADGARVHAGISVFDATGAIAQETNSQIEIGDSPYLTVADGVQTVRVLFHPSGADLDGFTDYDLEKSFASAMSASGLAYFHMRVNSSNLTDGLLRVGTLEVKDITDVIVASVAAKASVTAEQGALAYRDEAGDHAAATAQDVVLAQAAQAAAGIHETNTAIAESNAVDAAAGAVSAKEVAVSVASQGVGVLSDQFMPDGANGWTDWNGAPTKTPNEIYPTGQTFTWDLGTANGGALLYATDPLWVGAVGLNKFRVEIEFELVSGSVGGAGILFDWTNTEGQNSRATIDLADMVPEPIVTGRLMLASVIVTDPEYFEGTFSTNKIYLMANHSSLGGGKASKEYKVHRVQIYPINATDAAVSTSASAIADLEGNAAAMLAFRTVTGSNDALLELVSAFDPVQGGISQARIVASKILLEGSVRVPEITIDGPLSIDEIGGSFGFGKYSAISTADGVFMGNTANGFTLYASVTNGGEEQSIRVSEDGVEIKNAVFKIGADSFAQGESQTDGAVIDLGTSKTLNLNIQAGGGSGGYTDGPKHDYNTIKGATRSNTVIKLKDSGGTTRKTWTATGGRGGGQTSGGFTSYDQISPNSSYGNGGNGYSTYTYPDSSEKGYDGPDGYAGQNIIVNGYDISGVVGPELHITMSGNAWLEYSHTGETLVQAYPMSATPSAQGTFTVTGGVAGSFPNLSPDRGFWVLHNVPSVWTIDVGGPQPIVRQTDIMIFPAGRRPTWGTQHGGSSTVVTYAYYPMGGD